jgi:carboxyl-terminal processing protease
MFKYLIIISLLFLFSGCERMFLGPGPENSVPGTFDVFWKTIDEKYGLFPVKNVNWDSLYTIGRNQISSSSTEEELWNICSQLLSHFNDGHLTLFNKDYSKWYGSRQLGPDKAYGFSIDLIRNKFLDAPKVSGEGIITYGKIRNTNLGYIYISTFGPANSGREWIYDIHDVIREFQNTDAIIIDVRNNPGGFAKNDLYIASVFIDREITYSYSSLKIGPGHNDFGDPVAKIAYPPADTLRYNKKNVLLTNRFSGSGSEVVALIFSNLFYSTQIGDTTNGSFGEVTHVAQLPNGWTLNYPCTLTTLIDGSSPEGIGVIPDIYVDNTKTDISEGKDKVLEKAIDFLSESR